jgi:Fur family iron response transcriptional regulator
MRSTGSKGAAAPKLDLVARLRDAGLRPTRQRVALGRLLFASGDRHVTAENLHQEATRGGVQLSLATVYNTLHQFTSAGLLRQVIVDGDKTYFDTNIGDHHHFYFEDRGLLADIPGDTVHIDGLPRPPAGTEIERVEVVVRLKSRE